MIAATARTFIHSYSMGIKIMIPIVPVSGRRVTGCGIRV